MGYYPFNSLGSEGIGSGGYWDIDFRAHMTPVNNGSGRTRDAYQSYIPGVTKTEGVNHSFPNPRMIMCETILLGLGCVGFYDVVEHRYA
jgi:hypothetical protein